MSFSLTRIILPPLLKSGHEMTKSETTAQKMLQSSMLVSHKKKKKMLVEFHLIFLQQSKELHKHVHLVTCPFCCLSSSMGNKLLVYKNILVFILVDICKTNWHCFSLAAVRRNTCLLYFFPRLLSPPVWKGEVASVERCTDLICQAITLGMCYGGFAKRHCSVK